jgi:arylsulfatase
MMKQKNYATAIIGKWHLGDNKAFLPLSQGFDEYLGIPYSNDMWPMDYDGSPDKPENYKYKHPILPLIKDNDKIAEIKTLEDQSTLTGIYTDAAISFIKRNKNKPFFLYLAHSMPHVPINASKKFRGTSKQGLFGDVIQEIDDGIGRIMETLKSNGLDKKYSIVREYSVFPYFIDFAFVNEKVAVEIDGSQHLLPERKDRDDKKDELLKTYREEHKKEVDEALAKMTQL